MKMLSWNITKKCNLYCKHCYRDSGPEVVENELSTEEGFKFIEELKELGFYLLILSGGEPLLREDLEELVAKADEVGLYPVLGTNAVELDKNRIQSLKEAGLKGMGISLDSTDPELHNEFRGCEGVWQKTVNSIKKAVNAEIPVQINTTITSHNYKQLEEIVEFGKKLGVKAVHPFFLVPTGRGEYIEEESLRDKLYNEMIKKSIKINSEVDIKLKPTCAPQFIVEAKNMGITLPYSRGCLAGTSYCCVLPDGEVHICPYLPVKVGNLKEENFKDIWQKSKIFNELRDFNKYKGKCGNCEYIDRCGGCRARAFYYSDGNYLAEDPWCCVKE